ncbi:hypothetical protein KC351_g97 [Hortaea werneckii]|nr:hypothetical protein KC351_g97 [Hortaea werneckii]
MTGDALPPSRCFPALPPLDEGVGPEKRLRGARRAGPIAFWLGVAIACSFFAEESIEMPYWTTLPSAGLTNAVGSASMGRTPGLRLTPNSQPYSLKPGTRRDPWSARPNTLSSPRAQSLFIVFRNWTTPRKAMPRETGIGRQTILVESQAERKVCWRRKRDWWKARWGARLVEAAGFRSRADGRIAW